MVPGDPPVEPVALGQFHEDASTRIPGAGVTGEGSVVLRATLAPAPASRTVRLAVEVVPVGAPFTDSPSARSEFGSGGTAEVRVPTPSAGDYVWRAWAEDDAGRASAPASMPDDGGRFTVDPSAPTRLGQGRLDGSSLLVVGARTPEIGVVLRARVRSPLGEILRARFEVKPAGVPFDGTGVTLGSFVASGESSRGTAFLDPGSYHWRVRADHLDGSSSLWVGFGGNDDLALDADVERVPPTVPTVPALPFTLQQLRTDTFTGIPLGGTTGEDKVVLRGSVSGLAGLPCALEVELKPAAQAFDETAIVRGEYVASGAPSRVLVPVAAGAYHWRARTVDAYGSVSGWALYNYYGTGADFTVVPGPNTPPGTPGSLLQYQLNSNGMAASDPLLFDGMIVKATLFDPDFGNGIVLEVEVQPRGIPFRNVPSAAGSVVGAGQTATITLTNLSAGVAYHWQARAQDASGATSDWVEYFGSTSITYSSSPSNHGGTSEAGGAYTGCGLTGLEGAALLALLAVARRRRG
jgi:hypothetical protein